MADDGVDLPPRRAAVAHFVGAQDVVPAHGKHRIDALLLRGETVFEAVVDEDADAVLRAVARLVLAGGDEPVVGDVPLFQLVAGEFFGIFKEGRKA